MDYIISGVGGQGVVLASRLLARIAMDRGLFVRTAETIGMAQRGGSVVTHVRTGKVYSPLVPRSHADVIIGFEPFETVRALPFLKAGGALISSTKYIVPVSASLLGGMTDVLPYLLDRGAVLVDAQRFGAPDKALNVLLLAAGVAAGTLDFSADELRHALKKTVKPSLVDMNLRAIDAVLKGI